MQINHSILKSYKLSLLLAIVSLILYWNLAYGLQRTQYIKLITLYSALFLLFYKLIQICKHNTLFLTAISFLFRAVLILAIPNLSQDFYRFIWDGRMLLEGYNPYLYTVDSFINNGEFPVSQTSELYTGMGSLNAGHFTNYPPLNQFCFLIAALFAGKSIIGSAMIFRLLIIAADFGTLFFGKKLLKKLNIPVHNIFWYILNPFIIIELSGNLHFEGVMIFFLIWSLYLLAIGKWQWAGVIFACSVSVKLIPLIFLPLFFQRFTSTRYPSSKKEPPGSLNSKLQNQTQEAVITKNERHGNLLKWVSTKGITKLIGFYSITISIALLLFLPFYSSEFINNYTKTVGLWFQKFEFNASLYYIAREIGYTFRGWNEIAIIGKTIPLLVVFFILIITIFRKNKSMVQLISAMLLALSFYYFTATTVHPWYVATLLILSVFTKYKYPLVWSFVIIISYFAYINVDKADKSENLWIIALEYLIVYGVFLWEAFIKKASKEEA